MEFHDFRLLYDAYRVAGLVPESTTTDAFYAHVCCNALQAARADGKETRLMGLSSFDRALTERQWSTALSRPYYKLFPDTVEMLAATDLDVPCAFVHLPLSPVLFRFAEGRSILPGVESQGGGLRTALVAEYTNETGEPSSRGLLFLIDIGETDVIGAPVLTYQYVPIRDEDELLDAVVCRQLAVKARLAA